MDAVDKILAQWAKERPDLEPRNMGPIGRLKRVARDLSQSMNETFARYGLNSASFDVLATLRRSPAPHALSAGELMASMMITSGTMTNRIDQLIKTGWIKRMADPKDARRVIVALTDEGFALIDRAIEDHVQTQNALLGGLDSEEIETLDRLLRKLLIEHPE